jgi:hypothetical protein
VAWTPTTAELRYEVASGTDNHAPSVGLRLSW